MTDFRKMSEKKSFSARILSASALVVGLTIGTHSPAQAQSFIDALTATYNNNPTLLGARAKLRSVDEGVPQALANWRPEVSVSLGAGVQSIENTLNSGTTRDQTRQQGSASLDITQPLFRGFRTEAATQEAENLVDAERARLLATEQDVILDAITAFMGVYRERAVVKLNLSNEEVMRRQLQATRERFTVGEITRTDVNQAEARMARARADSIQAQAVLARSVAFYQNIVGELPSDEITPPALPTTLPDSKGDTLKKASTQNPNVVAAVSDLRAAFDNADEVRGELLPTVELTAGVSREYEPSGESGRSTTAEVALNVTVPIYQQGSVYSRLREARQDAAEQNQVIDQQRRNSVQSATEAWEDMIKARAQVDAFNAQIKANTVALNGVEREAAVGSRTILDILDAEQELLDSRIGLVRAEHDELIASYKVMASIGSLTAKKLELPVTHYDPMKHYNSVRDIWSGGKSEGSLMRPAGEKVKKSK